MREIAVLYKSIKKINQLLCHDKEKYLNELGVSLYDGNNIFRNTDSILNDLIKAISSLSEKKKSYYIRKLLE